MEIAKAYELARRLMNDHGLTGWSLAFDRAKVRFGVCRRKTKTISLSAALVALNSEEHVRDVILHEIAHALAPVGAGHGREWKMKAKEIGCRPERCYRADQVIAPPKKYVGTCPTCKREIKRFKRRRIACGTCCKGIFNEQHLFVWQQAVIAS